MSSEKCNAANAGDDLMMSRLPQVLTPTRSLRTGDVEREKWMLQMGVGEQALFGWVLALFLWSSMWKGNLCARGTG